MAAPYARIYIVTNGWGIVDWNKTTHILNMNETTIMSLKITPILFQSKCVKAEVWCVHRFHTVCGDICVGKIGYH